MELASVWQRQAPGGSATLLSFTVGVGTAIFVWFEGLDQLEAVYASIVTGKSVGLTETDT